MEVEQTRIVRLDSKAKMPQRGSPGAAGYDIYSIEESIVPAKGQALIRTGIAVGLPKGYHGRIAPRSGLAVKHGITTGAGVIDAEYRGEVNVLLFNLLD